MFVHLQVSTAYSLLSSTISIPRLVEQAKQYGYSSLAITDHNVMYGTLPFYKACIKAGIKPIIGLTADVTDNDGETCFPLVLLAENNIGYQHLLKISSAIQTSPKRAIPEKWMSAYSEGLIAITPGKTGEIEQLMLEGTREQAVARTRHYQEIFGTDSFYFTIQNDLTNRSAELMEAMVSLSKELDVPVVATNDVRYMDQSEAIAYETLVALHDGEKLTVIPDRDGHESYFKNKTEMADLFSVYPDALENTIRIAERCNVMIHMHQQLLPTYPLQSGESATQVLEKLCFEAITAEKLEDGQYISRLQYELSIIDEMNFNDYFLIVWDFMKYAREHGILTGPGRGSAAGSLVAYLLGITKVDPIKHDLLFERFLNPERITMPDIDIDFPDHRRDEVIEYVKNKYGQLHVAQIITFGTFAAKAAIRDTARVFGFNPQEMEVLSKLIPSKPGMTLERAYKDSPELRQFIEQSEVNRTLFETAGKLEGLPRHASTHAAGVVISSSPLTGHIAIQGEKTGTYLTQFPMEDLEEIGLLKMDFLGLRNLTLLERIINRIRIGKGKRILLDDIPFSDHVTFDMLQKGETTGIFQLESEGMRNVLRQLKPTRFEDIVAVNALYRPGPMENIPLYTARKHGFEKISYPHPDLEPILKVTYGVIVYQEQIMQIASLFAGFSLGQADLLRRAVSKKKKDVLDHERLRFVEGAVGKGYGSAIANDVYDLIVRFANYGFNRSHAVAYSFISWHLAWLKSHFPQYFMAELLTSVLGNEEKINAYLVELKRMGIGILPPSINKSHYPFTVEGEEIRFSLAGISGMGSTALKAIAEAKKNGPFEDLFDFCLRVPARTVNRKLLENLIHSGSFDEFGRDRATLLATLDAAIEHAELMRPAGTEQDLFQDDDLFRIKPKYMEAEPIGNADKLYYEKQAIGVYLSAHPTSPYKKKFKEVGALSLYELKDGQKNVSVGAFIGKVKAIRTKKGDSMAFLTLGDETGEIEAVAFPEVYKQIGKSCKEGQVVLVAGQVATRNGQLQFIIRQLHDADQLPKSPIGERMLFLKIKDDLDQPEILTELKEILLKHPGDAPVVLYYESRKQTIRLGRNLAVSGDRACIDQLVSLLGENTVLLK